jgi:glycosyltransferase involved in cell wall biosynthesis
VTALRQARGTVLVPAHNEEAVIGRCLAVLLGTAEPGELPVLVLSNGSTDATVERASAMGPGVAVVDLEVASKIAAVRAGLAQAPSGAVVVVDADVEVPTATVHALLDALTGDEPLVAAARPVFATAESSWAVRRYYAAWTALPYARHAAVGSGVLALNEAGRAALGDLPDVVNDDGWIRRAFPPDRRRLVEQPFTVHPARTARALVARRARVVNGNRQLDGVLGQDADGAGPRVLLGAVRRGDVGVLDAVVFVALTGAARTVAWSRRRRGDVRWSTDAGSRVVS